MDTREFEKEYKIDRTIVRRMAFNAACLLIRDIRLHEQGGTDPRREIKQFDRIVMRFKLSHAVAIFDANELLTY